MSKHQDFMDGLQKSTFGLSFTEALEQGICINCKEEALPKCYSEPGIKEYYISGLCEQCFDEIVG